MDLEKAFKSGEQSRREYVIRALKLLLFVAVTIIVINSVEYYCVTKMGFVKMEGNETRITLWVDFKKSIEHVESDLLNATGLKSDQKFDFYVENFKLDAKKTLLDYNFKKNSMPLIQFKIRESSKQLEESKLNPSDILLPPSPKVIELNIDCKQRKDQTMYFEEGLKVEEVKKRVRQQFAIPNLAHISLCYDIPDKDFYLNRIIQCLEEGKTLSEYNLENGKSIDCEALLAM